MQINTKENKMKKKICGLFAVIAAALAITALVISCMDPINPTGLSIGGNSSEDFPPPPAGYSYLRINIVESDARTIYPTQPTKQGWNVILTYVSGGSDTANKDQSDYTSNTAITLATGAEYSLKIEEYNSDDIVYAVYAHATNIVAGTTTTLTVNSTQWEVILNNGDGIFEWNIAAPSNFTASDTVTATMLITKSSAAGSGTDAQGSEIIASDTVTNLNNTGTGIAIEAGYYDVKVTFSRPNFLDRVLTEKLHVYQGMTSTWTYAATNAMISNAPYEISFNLQGGELTSGVTTASPISKNHGDLLEAADDPTDGISNDGWYGYPGANDTFVGWFTTSGGGIMYRFDDSFMVLRSRLLYAHFIVDGPDTLTLTLNNYALPSAVTLNPGNASISISDFEDPGVGSSATVTINISGASLTNAVASGASGFIWKWEGQEIDNSDAGITIQTVGGLGTGLTTAELVIDFLDDAIRGSDKGREGTHVYSVESVDGSPWSAYFTITVTND